ncbi:MAG: biotin/lipoyl attachment domain-containing protein [Anaerolineaceae bacterium]|nr:MAG: biotin/lipoyl attachment domain-containing protein [Anaerolineaceae bacterium]
MSLYTVTIENRTYRVNIFGNRCTVNDELVDAKVVPLNRNGLHLLQRGKQALELFLSAHEADTYQMHMLGGKRIVSRVTTRTRKHAQPGATDGQAAALAAPMHGLVVDVAALPGDTVEKGQTLVVLESMKMQMQLCSPRRGRIARIAVQPGSQVEKGALLVQFE